MDMNKVDTRFWVTAEAEEKSEEENFIAGAFTTKNWKIVRKLPEKTWRRLNRILRDNYQLPGIMDMSIEEVLALDES